MGKPGVSSSQVGVSAPLVIQHTLEETPTQHSFLEPVQGLWRALDAQLAGRSHRCLGLQS